MILIKILLVLLR
jgi:hypothetical protein